MDKLYDLTIYSFPNDNDREWSGIGLFASQEEAEHVAWDYLTNIPGFKDYYCESAVTEVPVIGNGEGIQKVFRFMGWNADEDGDETDIIHSACYTSEEDARAALELAKRSSPRQEWALNQWVIGKKEWAEGFTREYPSGRIAPTLQEIRAALENAMEPRQMVKVTFHYSDIDRYFFPLAVGRDLFLCAEEDDFLLDGFTIRRIRDVEALEPRDGLYTEIMAGEGWLNRLAVPDVEITDWKSVFNSLQKLGRNIIVEEEHLEGDSQFVIGWIQAVEPDHVLLLPFDADGIWEQEPWEIPYRDITSVSFDTRYINVFSKYLPPRP